MEVNTGYTVTIILISIYKTHCKHIKLQSTMARLGTYGNDRITPSATVTATVSYSSQSYETNISSQRADHGFIFSNSAGVASIKLIQETVNDDNTMIR